MFGRLFSKMSTMVIAQVDLLLVLMFFFSDFSNFGAMDLNCFEDSYPLLQNKLSQIGQLRQPPFYQHSI
jgi:hypothetical protein